MCFNYFHRERGKYPEGFVEPSSSLEMLCKEDNLFNEGSDTNYRADCKQGE